MQENAEILPRLTNSSMANYSHTGCWFTLSIQCSKQYCNELVSKTATEGGQLSPVDRGDSFLRENDAARYTTGGTRREACQPDRGHGIQRKMKRSHYCGGVLPLPISISVAFSVSLSVSFFSYSVSFHLAKMPLRERTTSTSRQATPNNTTNSHEIHAAQHWKGNLSIR